MHSLTLYRIDPARNMQHFYHLDIQPDLFGNHCVIREWGRIGRSGQMRIIPYPTGDEAQYALHNGKWPECSTESTPILEFCLQCSSKQESP